MSIIKFVTSKVFFKQLALAIVAVVVISFLVFKWLNIYTNNGDFETVPDLKGKSIETVQIELKDNNLKMVIQDSANFNPKYPKYSVIEQNPVAGAQVKENRKMNEEEKRKINKKK